MFELVQVIAAAVCGLPRQALSQASVTTGNHMVAQACAITSQMRDWLNAAATGLIEDWNRGMAEGTPTVADHQVAAAIWSLADAPTRNLLGYLEFSCKVSPATKIEFYKQMAKAYRATAEVLAGLPEMQNPTELMKQILANEKTRCEDAHRWFELAATRESVDLEMLEIEKNMKSTTHVVDSCSPENAGIEGMLHAEASLNPSEDIDLGHGDSETAGAASQDAQPASSGL